MLRFILYPVTSVVPVRAIALAGSGRLAGSGTPAELHGAGAAGSCGRPIVISFARHYPCGYATQTCGYATLKRYE